MKYIVKFFPEIMIKGDAVKKKLVRQLHENLKRLLKRVDEQIHVQKYWDKIEVFLPPQADYAKQVEVLLLNTSGIDQVWQVQQYPVTDLNSVIEKVVPFALPLIKDKTFVVRAKRSGEHSFTSMQLERETGHVLCEQGESKGVSLHRAEVKIQFDVHDQHLNIIEAKFPGLGGYPLGSQGEALSLMSGGFDSTVASYMAIKRGLKTHYVFFNLGGTAHELGVKQVAIFLWRKYQSSHRIRFVTIPFESVVAELFNSVHESYMGVMLKRLMLQAAEQVADEMDIGCLITGESISQVSSQTLKNLAAIDQATQKLVFRPLSFMDKSEIIGLAEKIGTRKFAESMPEYCGVISKNPVTEASAKRTRREHQAFDMSVLQTAVDNRKVEAVDQLVDAIVTAAPIEQVTELQANDVLIDIRNEDERLQSPLPQAEVVPFYELSQHARHWHSDKRYLLYCHKGVMSQLHAQYLRDQGFENVWVYSPSQKANER